MKTILDSQGNRRLFTEMLRMNRLKRFDVRQRHGFTVNVWQKRRTGHEFDAGFHRGTDVARRPANFDSPTYIDGVLYRIRVIPKRSRK